MKERRDGCEAACDETSAPVKERRGGGKGAGAAAPSEEARSGGGCGCVGVDMAGGPERSGGDEEGDSCSSGDRVGERSR